LWKEASPTVSQACAKSSRSPGKVLRPTEGLQRNSTAILQRQATFILKYSVDSDLRVMGNYLVREKTTNILSTASPGKSKVNGN